MKNGAVNTKSLKQTMTADGCLSVLKPRWAQQAYGATHRRQIFIAST